MTRRAGDKSAVPQHFDHPVVGGKDVGRQLGDSRPPRRPSPDAPRESAHAEPLRDVDHCHAQLAGPPGEALNEACDSKKLLGPRHAPDDYQAHVMSEVQLGEVMEILRGEILLHSKEPVVDGLGAQALEVLPQPLLVVGLDGPDVNRRSVAEQRVGRVGGSLRGKRQRHLLRTAPVVGGFSSLTVVSGTGLYHVPCHSPK